MPPANAELAKPRRSPIAHPLPEELPTSPGMDLTQFIETYREAIARTVTRSY